MGILRLLLALSVAVWHLGAEDSAGWLVSGYVAVVAFFIISGFYMSMVINEAYAGAPGWISRFYLSRSLRLFPVYGTIATLMVVYWAARSVSFGQIFNLDLPLHPLARGAVVLSNLGLFGLDAVALTSILNGLPLMRVVGPAWSLAIELQFYAAAPFFVTRSLRFCALVLIGTIVLRLSLFGLDYDPWRYFFAPADWCFFVMGVVGHRLSMLVRDARTIRWLGLTSLAIVPISACLGDIRNIQDLDTPLLWVFYISLAAGVPFIFAYTKNFYVDRMLGDLSYPIYLVHPLIYIVLLDVLTGTPKVYAGLGGIYSHGAVWCLAALTCVIAAAAALRVFIELPIDRVRARLRRRPSGPSALGAGLTVGTNLLPGPARISARYASSGPSETAAEPGSLT